MLRYGIFLMLLLLSCHAQSQGQGADPVQYRLGVFPYMEPRQTIELWGPVAADMERILARTVKLESTNTFSEFGRELEDNKFDIALIQPFDFQNVVEKLGYIPIAQLSVPLVSEIVVRDDSPYKTLEDLRGTTIAVPPVEAANTRMVIRTLSTHKLVPGSNIELKFLKSHDSCLQQVWAGQASACGSARPPIMIFEKRMKAKLRTIFKTPEIPHVLFVVSQHMPAADREKLQNLILGWNGTDAGRELLKNLSLPGFMAPQIGQYAILNKLVVPVSVRRDSKIQPKELLLGVFPFLATRTLVQNFSGVLPALSNATGIPVYLRTASSFDAFSDDIAAQRFDLMIIQPFDYAKAVKYGYQPLAAMKNMLDGTFFVLSNSAYQDISDFRGKTVAMPPYNSVQSRLGRQALKAAGLRAGKDVTISYMNTHESCLQQVHMRQAVACITSEIALNMLSPEVGAGLRQVGKTEKLPGVLFMVHKRISAERVQKLKHEILSWKESDAGRKILSSMGLGDFDEVDKSAYSKLPNL